MIVVLHFAGGQAQRSPQAQPVAPPQPQPTLLHAQAGPQVQRAFEEVWQRQSVLVDFSVI